MQQELLQKITHRHIVGQQDLAHFKLEKVHNVCSTFALAREVEWTTRQYIHKIKSDGEDGIGTMLEIKHHDMALLGEEFIVHSNVEEFKNGELICAFEVRVGEKLIASGRTGQKLLLKTKIEERLKKAKSGQKR